MSQDKIQFEKGIALVLSVIILSLLLAAALGISTILVGQMTVLRGMEQSVQAYFAADSGIERVLYDDSQGVDIISTCPCSGNLDNGASYNVLALPPGPDCIGVSYCLQSIGSFRDSRRAIEIER